MAVAIAGCASAAGEAKPEPLSSPLVDRPAGASHLEVILLGTQAGPTVTIDRAGISSVVVVDGKSYVVDCGRSSTTQYRRAGLSFNALANIFITHLHADHVVDYYSYFMLGGNGTGPGKPPINDALTSPVHVYGPGAAGGLPPAFGGGTVSVASPESPTPGLAELTRRCSQAFAYSNNVLQRDTGIQDTSALPVVTEIPLPDVGASYSNTHPAMEPFPVMSDDRVRVTATLVPHGPVFPAFAYRFDTEYGSVTFSGDTALSDNLISLARGSDVLVHEALNVEGSRLPPAVLDHMLKTHVSVHDVGAVAQRADVPHLVLSHIADLVSGRDELDVTQWTNWAREGYGGEVTIGEDLQRIVVA